MIMNICTGGTIKSTIIVTAPTGSTVYITDSVGNTKTATEENGTWTFKHCNIGTWTVHASLGEQVAEQTVTITADGQTESVELYYRFYLYNKGDQCTETTGNWSAKAYLKSGDTSQDYIDEKAPSVSFGADSCTISMSKHATSGAFYKGILVASNPIDFSAFRTLNINITAKNAGVDFGVIDGIKNGFNFLASSVLGSTAGVYSVDCSNITSAAYVALYIRASTSNASMTFDEIWLER